MESPGSPRLELYRAVARGLNRFYERWTGPFCSHCLEVTRRHHRGDPRADVDLVEGLFPGCCHAGVAEALWVPGASGEGRFPPALRRLMERARAGVALPSDSPVWYRVRERETGVLARGVACAHLGPLGCRLGELKGPLCLSYLCDGVRTALATVAGWELVGDDSDDFCGSREVLRAVVRGRLRLAERGVKRLEERLHLLDRVLAEREAQTGESPYLAWDRECTSAGCGGPRPAGEPGGMAAKLSTLAGAEESNGRRPHGSPGGCSRRRRQMLRREWT